MHQHCTRPLIAVPLAAASRCTVPFAELADDDFLVPANTSVLVRRVPLTHGTQSSTSKPPDAAKPSPTYACRPTSRAARASGPARSGGARPSGPWPPPPWLRRPLPAWPARRAPARAEYAERAQYVPAKHALCHRRWPWPACVHALTAPALLCARVPVRAGPCHRREVDRSRQGRLLWCALARLLARARLASPPRSIEPRPSLWCCLGPIASSAHVLCRGHRSAHVCAHPSARARRSRHRRRHGRPRQRPRSHPRSPRTTARSRSRPF